MVTHGIGGKPLHATAILRAHGLAPFRGILTPESFRRVHPKAPAAKTVLIPEVVFWLMAVVGLGAGSMAGAILAFWSSLRAAVAGLPAAPVTEEAFCKARSALRLRFFLLLFADVVDRFEQRFDLSFRWKGRRLLAFDGSDVELPNDPHLRRLYPPASNQHGRRGRPQARLVALVGLWSGLCHAFRWTDLSVSEQVSARLERLCAGLLTCSGNQPDCVPKARALR